MWTELASLYAGQVAYALVTVVASRWVKADFLKSERLWTWALVWLTAGAICGIVLHVSTNSQAIRDVFSANPFIGRTWYVLFAVVVGPIVEELFYRRLLIGSFPDHRFVSGIGSVGLFAFAHNWSLAAGLGGAVYALAYITTGRVWFSITAHATSNAMVLWLGLVSR